MNIHQRQSRTTLSPKQAAEALFVKRAAPAAVPACAPRVLEDVSKPVVVETKSTTTKRTLARHTYAAGRRPSVPTSVPLTRRILDDAPRFPAVAGIAPVVAPADETISERVMRLIGAKRFEEAARLAKKLIDSGNGHQFFTLAGPAYEEARAWFAAHSHAAVEQKQAGWFDITPERAQVLLEANPENRQIESAGLAKRMRDMADGRWAENGEAVIVAKDALLNDGQHRCWAALLIRGTFSTNMAWGVDRASRTTVDSGTKRPVGSQLGIRGELCGAAKAGIVADVFRVFHERQATDAEKEDFYYKNKESIDFAFSITNNRMPARHARSPIGAGLFYLDAIGADREEVNEFMGIVRTKLGHTRGCPAFILREELVEGRARRSSREWALATVQHFVLWRRAKKVYKLTVPKSIPTKADL